MKKVLLSFAVLLMGCALFTACGDDDDNNDNQRPVNPQDSTNVKPTPADSVSNDSTGKGGFAVADGVFVVGSGNSMSNIVGGLTYFDYAQGKATANIFKEVNGRELGVTANDGMVYGSKLYVVVDGENTIEVMDAKTLKSVKQLSTTTLLGEQEGKSPRRIVAKDGCIFVSTFGGYVAVIDTVNFELTAKLEAGSYPEGMAFSGKMLFVANSDYGMGTNPSISIFSTDVQNKSFRKMPIDLKDSLINNPTTLVANGYDLYILCGDTYDPVDYSVKQKGGLRKYTSGNQGLGNNVNIVENVSMMAAQGTKLYLILNAYVQPEYKVLDMTNDQLTSLSINNGVDVPNALAVDPAGNFVVAGYSKNPDTGYGDYSAAGKAIRYSATGTKMSEFETAVGPSAVFFSTK
jgi:hypothetical protein